MLKYHIQTIDLASDSSAISFSNIPQNYSDLLVVLSARATTNPSGTAVTDGYLAFNGVSTNQSGRLLYGQGSGSGGSGTYSNLYFWLPSSGATANTFGSTQIYIPDYASNAAKSTSQEITTENNGSFAYSMIFAGLWNSTATINSITFNLFNSSSFAQYSSASLYGIKRGADGVTNSSPVAQGGTVTTSGGYTIHTFTSSGTFFANRDLTVEYVVVAGGGGGGKQHGGGGGAGGYRSSVAGEFSGGGASAESALRLSSGTGYTVIVGAGGIGAPGSANGAGSAGGVGNNSVFATVSCTGGGGGATWTSGSATSGGSGGGGNGSGVSPSNVAAAGTANQGFAGGNGGGQYNGGGGGGAGQVGGTGTSTTVGNVGGNGVSSSITGTAVTRGGGGGSGINNGTTVGAGGSGGGGNGGNANPAGSSTQSPTNGTANTGGGGGGHGAFATPGANGGSGVVIIRYLTPA